VQEETFGPVAVIQRANDWDQAIGLCNAVRHGLVASLFSPSQALQEDFLERCRAGILKLNTPTAGAAADAPFVGWKASGLGPPEHGVGDRQFYTRHQTVYT
jgi:alpha-ketoglutaric semialdehyde dehydrogenase